MLIKRWRIQTTRHTTTTHYSTTHYSTTHYSTTHITTHYSTTHSTTHYSTTHMKVICSKELFQENLILETKTKGGREICSKLSLTSPSSHSLFLSLPNQQSGENGERYSALRQQLISLNTLFKGNLNVNVLLIQVWSDGLGRSGSDQGVASARRQEQRDRQR